MSRTAEEALTWARANPTRDGGTWSQWCQSFIVRALGLRAAGNANQALAASTIASTDQHAAPVGALHWWLHGTRASGHVGISFGGEQVLMTDAPVADQWPGHRTVGMTTVTRYDAKKTGYLYQGWSLDMARQPLQIGLSPAGGGQQVIVPEEDSMTQYQIIAPVGMPDRGIIAPGFGLAFGDEGDFNHLRNVLGLHDVQVTLVGSTDQPEADRRALFHRIINLMRTGSGPAVDAKAIAAEVVKALPNGADTNAIVAAIRGMRFGVK